MRAANEFIRQEKDSVATSQTATVVKQSEPILPITSTTTTTPTTKETAASHEEAGKCVPSKNVLNINTVTERVDDVASHTSETNTSSSNSSTTGESSQAQSSNHLMYHAHHHRRKINRNPKAFYQQIKKNNKTLSLKAMRSKIAPKQPNPPAPVQVDACQSSCSCSSTTNKKPMGFNRSDDPEFVAQVNFLLQHCL